MKYYIYKYNERGCKIRMKSLKTIKDFGNIDLAHHCAYGIGSDIAIVGEIRSDEKGS